jgi:DNA invertase Pin-like site-specific DNA recombinase
MNAPDHDRAGPAPAQRNESTTAARQDQRGWRSTKISDRHLDRRAIVYIRQSTPQQVLEHKESRERQYALADLAVALGWPKERVQIIDEDQGHSGKTAASRLGFQRLLAEVTMDHVGLVLGLEMSRIARNNRDWHNLLEMCAIFGTNLADEDGVYDPRDTNDRLLLGLKGTISEFELVTMRNRLDRGKLNKATRGELFFKVPCGYIKLPTGEVALEPDEQARNVVQLIFDKFAELGTIYGVHRYLLKNGIRLGMRVQDGPRRGHLEWRRPSLATLNQMLHNPMYAGAYAYGRRPCDARRKASGVSKTEQRRVPMSEWKVLKRDHLPAYITWERYLANQERMHQNRSLPDTSGTPREGVALLTRLLVCGTCKRLLHAVYPSRTNIHYMCDTHLYSGTEKTCHGLKAAVIDGLVSDQVLRALEPAALELSLTAIADIDRERERLHRHWQQRLERAEYEVQRAERQYQAVEPENRLVARTLERRWEEAMREQQQLREEYDRFLREQPSSLSADEEARIRELSRDIPALWNAPGTTAADRKEIIRLVVERVVVHVRNDSEEVEATIHWRDGSTSHHMIVRPVRRYEHLHDFDRLVAHLTRWRREGHSAGQIAEKLQAAGFRPPRGHGEYTKGQVQQLLRRCGLTQERRRVGELGPNEWWLSDLAVALELPAFKLRDWAARGWVRARKTPAERLWIVWADKSEQNRLRRLKALSRRGVVAFPNELITPKEVVKKR